VTNGNLQIKVTPWNELITVTAVVKTQ